MAKRKIEIKKGDEKREGYGTFEFDFLEKVRLTGTGHAVWSRNADSMVAAAEIDPRFAGDKEFPNQWRTLGGEKPGPANPWGGAAMYLKITKLSEPAGAVFVEQHVIFAEPTGWFDGANLLRSKLPIAMQQNVRNMRQEFKKSERVPVATEGRCPAPKRAARGAWRRYQRPASLSSRNSGWHLSSCRLSGRSSACAICTTCTIRIVGTENCVFESAPLTSLPVPLQSFI